MSPDKGKSQAERRANLFISKHKPDSSCETYTGKGKIREAQEDLWLFILGKLVLPESSTGPFAVLFFLDSAWPCIFHLDLPQMQKVGYLDPLNPGVQKRDRTLLDRYLLSQSTNIY